MYSDLIHSTFDLLKRVEKELTDIYYYQMGLRYDPRDVFYIIEDLHINFCRIEDELSQVTLPEALGADFRPSDDSVVLTKNPLLMARL